MHKKILFKIFSILLLILFAIVYFFHKLILIQNYFHSKSEFDRDAVHKSFSKNKQKYEAIVRQVEEVDYVDNKEEYFYIRDKEMKEFFGKYVRYYYLEGQLQYIKFYGDANPVIYTISPDVVRTLNVCNDGNRDSSIKNWCQNNPSQCIGFCVFLEKNWYTNFMDIN